MKQSLDTPGLDSCLVTLYLISSPQGAGLREELKWRVNSKRDTREQDPSLSARAVGAVHTLTTGVVAVSGAVEPVS